MDRYDVYPRCARRHLSAREERAVSLTAVGQQAETWSAAEIAGRERQDEGEVERILERFEAAGIVERVEAPEGSSRCLAAFRAFPSTFSGPPPADLRAAG